MMMKSNKSAFIAFALIFLLIFLIFKKRIFIYMSYTRARTRALTTLMDIYTYIYVRIIYYAVTTGESYSETFKKFTKIRIKVHANED